MVILLVVASSFMFFFFNDTATTEIYTLSLHDALPISLRVPLHRFFAVTSVILMLVAFQLTLTGLHELSEARWLPSSKGEMAILGPIVRNELFFFVFIFGAAMLLVLREWQAASHAKIAKESLNDAEKRLLESQNRRQRRWMIAAATASLTVILVLTADF